MNNVRVFLKAKEEREIQQGFPWVFDNEISYVKYRKSDRDEWQQTSLEETYFLGAVCAQQFF